MTGHDLEEPVRRYLAHALHDPERAPTSMRLTMHGRIDVGLPLTFKAEQDFHGHEFEWRARAGRGPLKPLRVVDTYRAGAGSTEGKVLGRWRFLDAHDADTARAAAGRAAAEAIWVPGTLLPGAGARWRAIDPATIAVRLEVPPEAPEVTFGIGPDGALRTISLMRWGDVGRDGFGYIPFGGDVLAERRFGSVTIPSHVRVGWWWGTPRYKPFFDAEVTDAVATGS